VGERPLRPTRADYVAWRTATTRWRDDDAYGHLNNATYYELFDTAVNAHLYEATGVDVRALPQIGVVAETGCRYFREIGFPEPIEMGLVVDKVGTSSIVYRIGLFQGASDEAAAEGRPHPDAPVAAVDAWAPAVVCHRGGDPTGPPRRKPVLAIILMMSLGVLVAAAVAVYVAYPHRGEEMPVAPQLGDAMRKGVDALPTLEDSESRV
jgi:acyl-CoA thioester hydrolase